MASLSLRRLQRDFKEVTDINTADEGMKVELVNDNLYRLKGEIIGPKETPYEGGVFILDIEVPANYPFVPPKMQFTTKLWHPNVSSVTGAICLDILKDQWAASMTLRTVFLSLQALLCDPKPDDPQDAVVAKQCLDNSPLFNDTAKYWAQIYAGAPGARNPEFDRKVKQLMDIGDARVSRSEVIAALSGRGWNLEAAVAQVFN